MAYHGMLPREWIDKLNERNDIYDVISSEGVELKPKGGRFWGLCPFHGEKTASFSVNRQKQMFYCFGCHKGGSAIKFIQEFHHKTFPEACEYLAERCGLEMPELQGRDEAMIRLEAHRKRLREACREAAVYYYKQLTAGQNPGLAYFLKRGLNADTVKRFGLGYAPDGWDGLLNHLTGLGFTEEELLDADLISHNDTRGTYYDRFRNRVIYPIRSSEKFRDGRGEVVAFGARVLDDSKPKYLNTGDTPIYSKRHVLYGLDLQNGVKLDHLIMVEGYMDVIGLYMQGVTNAVASCGTALTDEQAKLLKRYVPLVYIAYDGDFAGQHGMLRGLDILVKYGLEVRVIVFPDNLDPDEYVRAYGRDAFETLKEKAFALNEFKLEVMSRDYNLSDANDRTAFAKKACGFLATLSPVEQERYLELVHGKSGFSLETLRAQLRGSGQETRAENIREFPSRSQAAGTPLPEKTAKTTAMCGLLHAMMLSRQVAETVALQDAEWSMTDGDDEFSTGWRAVFERILADYSVDVTPSAAAMIDDLSGEDAQIGPLLLQALYDDGTAQDPMQLAGDCVSQIRHWQRQEAITSLREQQQALPKGSPEREAILQKIQSILQEDQREWKKR